ncbi:hypothetical protein Tco_0962794, partial [Tanacetum coccineum]
MWVLLVAIYYVLSFAVTFQSALLALAAHASDPNKADRLKFLHLSRRSLVLTLRAAFLSTLGDAKPMISEENDIKNSSNVSKEEVDKGIDMAEMKHRGFKDNQMQLLKDVSGAFRPGILTALIGNRDHGEILGTNKCIQQRSWSNPRVTHERSVATEIMVTLLNIIIDLITANTKPMYIWEVILIVVMKRDITPMAANGYEGHVRGPLELVEEEWNSTMIANSSET